MKKLYLALLQVGLLVNCTQDPEKRLIESVSTELKLRLNDADGYEFVSIRKVDSLTYGDNISFLTKKVDSDLNLSQSFLSIYNEDFDSVAPKLNRLRADIDSMNRLMSDLSKARDSINNQLNTVAYYGYEFDYRSKNAFGAKVLNTCRVYSKPDHTLIQILLDPSDSLSIKRIFPGYEQIATQNKQLPE